MSLLIIKLLFTLFVIVMIPVYWKKYGFKNFFWLSDVGVFLTFFALWFESPLLNSMAVIGILVVELVWNVDYFFQLIFGRNLLGIADYMFDATKSKFLRALSLFHVATPIIWIWLLLKWGYDPRAVYYQIILTVIVFGLSYLFPDPTQDINWIALPKTRHWKKISSLTWLFIVIIGYPVLFIIPMHFLLKHISWFASLNHFK